MTASKTEPMTATIEMIEAGGRTLRVAHWRLDEKSDHPPILFFNGIGANIEAVAPLAERLAERGFVMFDMPGTGESPDPTVPYNPFTMSWTANQISDQLGLGEVDVGRSGAAMAQHFTLQYPKRTRRLVLVATTAGMLMVPGAGGPYQMANPRRYIDPDFMNEHFMTLYGGMTMGWSKEDHIVARPPSRAAISTSPPCRWTSVPAFMAKEVLVMMGDEDQIVPLINGRTSPPPFPMHGWRSSKAADICSC